MPVVKHLWVFVETTSYPLATILSNNRKSMCFHMSLDRMTNVSKFRAWDYFLDTLNHCLVSSIN